MTTSVITHQLQNYEMKVTENYSCILCWLFLPYAINSCAVRPPVWLTMVTELITPSSFAYHFMDIHFEITQFNLLNTGFWSVSIFYWTSRAGLLKTRTRNSFISDFICKTGDAAVYTNKIDHFYTSLENWLLVLLKCSILIR